MKGGVNKQAKAPSVDGAFLCCLKSGLAFFVFWLGGGGGCRGYGAFGFVAWLADVDAALEEGAVFDGDAGGDDVAGEGAFAADVDAIGGLAVAADFAEDDDFAGA